MILDDYLEHLHEGVAGVMGCRAAKNSILLWRRRAARDPRKKPLARRRIAKFQRKVARCKQRGMMV